MTSLTNYLKILANIAVFRTDARRWRRQLSQFSSIEAPRHPEVILFCDVLGSYAVSKAESLYAVAFRQFGYDSIALLGRPDRTIERIYRAAGVHRFVYLSELSPDPSCFRDRAESLLGRLSDINDILPLEIDDVRVGRNVLSKTVRQFRVGRLDNQIPDHRAAMIRHLAHSLATIEGIGGLLASEPIRAAFFCERGYTPAGEIFDVCCREGIDAIQWTGAPMDGTLLFKRYRMANRAMHPLSLSEESWRRARTMAWCKQRDEDMTAQLMSHYKTGAWYNRQQLQHGKTIQDKQAVQETLGLDPKKKSAVIFCHILYDATFFYGHSLFDDYQSWLVETVRAAVANPSLNWVVKAHPVNVWRSRADGVSVEPLELNAIHAALGALPGHVRFMPADTPINTYSLFGAADYGLTVRGTIGLELPCFGIPVVTAGTGRYSGQGFTIDPRTPDAYRSLLATLQDVPPLDEATVNFARRYAYATLRWRPLPLESFDFRFGAINNGQMSALRNNVTLAQNAPIDLTSTPDLGRMARWAVEQSSEDLLAPNAEDDIAPSCGDTPLDPSVPPIARTRACNAQA